MTIWRLIQKLQRFWWSNFCHLKKQWIKKSFERYGDYTPGKSTIIDWYAKFKRDRTNTDDAERSGRPKSAVVPKKKQKSTK